MRGMKRTATLAALTLAGVAVLTGCNDQQSSQAARVPTSASATALQTQTVKVVKRVSPAVVQLECGNSLGSGIVYDDRGDVVTNAHVINGASSCGVMLSDRSKHSASLVGRDTSHDIAVVRLSGTTPKPASFGNSSDVRVGDTVFAVGNPLGLQSSVTQGIVSSLNRNVAESPSVDLSALIQTSAEINPGNSGGALVDLAGRVIGIPTLTAVDPQLGNSQAPGIGFAIPSDTVKSVASSLIGAS
jgi:putative serine protease PepD